MTVPVTDKLKIKDVAAQTGVAAATIRMWEQRYGFPNPDRTASGYRLYTEEDVAAIRAVLGFRDRGLTIPAAIEQVRTDEAGEAVNPSLYAAVVAVDSSAHPRVLRRSTLAAMSHAIEDEVLARGSRGLVFGAFQLGAFYGRVAHRYDQLALRSEATVVFADFPEVVRGDASPTLIPIGTSDALGNEWAVVVDSPGYCAALLAWERPNAEPGEERRFEALFSLDPRAVRRAAQVAAQLASARDADVGADLRERLNGRPLATEPPTAAVTALTGRMVAYLDERL